MPATSAVFLIASIGTRVVAVVRTVLGMSVSLSGVGTCLARLDGRCVCCAHGPCGGSVAQPCGFLALEGPHGEDTGAAERRSRHSGPWAGHHGPPTAGH